MTWFSPDNSLDSNVLLLAGGGGGNGNDGGGAAGGLTGSSGSGGTGRDGGGGGGGTQSAGGSGGPVGSPCSGGGGAAGSSGQGGQGGYMTTCNNNGTGAGGGGGGYYGGGGGGGSGDNSGQGNTGGGGGGSSYIASSTSLTVTSTATGVNSGNGSITILELYNPVTAITSSTQDKANGTTSINEGSSTGQNTVVLGATLTSYIAANARLQIEVEPSSTAFTGIPNVTSTPFVTSGGVATTSFTGANGAYHWQMRTVNTAGNNTSSWKTFGPTATSTDFVIAVPHVHFTFPTNGTTTPNFPNWELNADTVTSTDSYALTVDWDDLTGDPMQSSTINASGTQLLSGVNVPKPTSSLDYTYDGTPVAMDATATLYDAGTVSATSSVSFTEDTTVAPLNCTSNDIQCVSYKYDNDGNITQVVDDSATNAAITVNYTYDSLNRLLTASSSNAASGGNYLQTFTYDPVGNVLTGPDGTYSYTGGSSYADPDAVAKITNGSSTTTFTYDNDGNLTNASSGFNYTWDYNNRLLTATSSNASTSYGYDYTGQRVELATGSSTTYYPETTYNVNGGTITKSIFADGLLVSTIVNASTSGYQFYRAITVTSTASIASGTLTSFPMLVSSTVASWGSASHSGKIQNLVTAPNGGLEPADLVFATSSANCGTANLNFETESYVSSTGALVDWVNVPKMATGTVIYACYDNASITTDQSHPSSTWNSNFFAVYHMEQGQATSTTSAYILDSTANANNASSSNPRYPTSTVGLINGGFSFNGTSSQAQVAHIQENSNLPINQTMPYTVSFWVDAASSSNSGEPFAETHSSAGNSYFSFGVTATGKLNIFLRNESATTVLNVNSSGTVFNSAWNMVTWTENNGSGTFYINGLKDSTDNYTPTSSYVFVNDAFGSGWRSNGTINPYTGSMDELELASSTFTPQWIATEYNNQNSPGTFYSVGSETSAGGSSTSTVMNYVSVDDLGGTNVVTNASGTVVETADYYPYGAIRLDNATGTPQQRKYIGQQYDAGTQLSYLNSRYYSGSQGEFNSEDSSFLAMGNSTRVQQLTGQNQMALLANPQQLNPYSYSQDNPIIKSDPSGNWYIDINFTFISEVIPDVPVGLGPTTGLLISEKGLYAYFGGAAGGPLGAGESIAYSSQNPSVGWGTGLSAYAYVGGGASYGDGELSSEYGIGTSGGGLSETYTRQLIGFGASNVGTNQSIQNANPVSSVKAANPILTTSGSTTSSGHSSSSGSGGSLSVQQAQTIQSDINTIESEIQTLQREVAGR